MQAALTLLITAMSLLTQVQSTPNISPEFKAQVIIIAQNAITFAQDTIKNDTTTPQTPPVTAIVNTPVTTQVTNSNTTQTSTGSTQTISAGNTQQLTTVQSVTYDYSIMPSVTSTSPFHLNYYFDNVLSATSTNLDTGKFTISTNSGEPIYLDRLIISTNINTNLNNNYISIYDYSDPVFRFTGGNSARNIISSKIDGSKEYSVQINNYNSLPSGTYTITINEIRVVGLASGDYKEIGGLPITFTYEVK